MLLVWSRVCVLSLAQCDIARVGSWLCLRNAKVDMYHNRMRLGVDRWGILELADEQQLRSCENMKIDVDPKKNQSLCEYELIEQTQQ